MHPGSVRVPKTKRAFSLDSPCDLKPDEAVTFVLSLHGGGMIGNWHRHYFPIMDLKQRYRLVIATPTAVNSLWNPENDDVHLRNIVNLVYETSSRTSTPLVNTSSPPKDCPIIPSMGA